MKKVLIVLILTFLFAGNIFSQDSSKSNEIGIHFTSAYEFGIRYKRGENLKFRVTALSLNQSKSEREAKYYDSESKYTGFGLNFGLELPVSITEHFDFFYGGEIIGSYSYQKNESRNYYSKVKDYKIGLGIILGFAYKINQEFVVSAEVVPMFYYNYHESSDYNYKNFGFKFTNETAGITVGYRF